MLTIPFSFLFSPFVSPSVHTCTRSFTNLCYLPWSTPASWQKEWRSPKLHPTLCPAPFTSAEHINQQHHPASINPSLPAQTSPLMNAPLPTLSLSHVLPQSMDISTITPNPGATSQSVAPSSEMLSTEYVSTSCSQTLSASIPPLPSASVVSLSIAPASPSSSPSTPYPCVSTHLAVSDAPLCSSPDVGPVVTASVVSEPGREQTNTLGQMFWTRLHVLN